MTYSKIYVNSHGIHILNISAIFKGIRCIHNEQENKTKITKIVRRYSLIKCSTVGNNIHSNYREIMLRNTQNRNET